MCLQKWGKIITICSATFRKGRPLNFLKNFSYFLILTTTEKVFTSRPLQWNWGSSGASVSETLCRSWALCRCNLKAVGDIWRHQTDSSHKKSKLNFIIDSRICNFLRNIAILLSLKERCHQYCYKQFIFVLWNQILIFLAYWIRIQKS